MPKVVDKLIEDFWSQSGRDLAYQSLLEIAHDNKSTENKEAILFLLSVLSCLKDKSQVEDLLYTVLRSRNSDLKCDILFSLGPYFRYLSDKNKAWSTLHKLTVSRDIYIKEAVAFSIGPAFAFIPEKEQAMKDLFRLVKCFDEEIQENAVMSLGFAFPYLIDKTEAWDILFQIAMTDNPDEGLAAAKSLEYAFPHVPDKVWAWDDLLEIINSDLDLCSHATISSLFNSYQWYPNKIKGYDDLISLMTHENKEVQAISIISIGMIFSYIPDKKRGQEDLISLLKSENIDCKDNVIISLGNAFSHLPDKIKIWEILHELVKNSDASIRKGVAFAIGDACPNLPFPEDSLNDLVLLASDGNSSVRMAVAYSLGFIYPDIKRSNHVLSCLQILSDDKNSSVRMRANHSLGKICIYEASNAKEKNDLEYLLQKAINYFEKTANEECHLNPASFCYHFYRSFDAVAFKNDISKEEIEKYIIEAKEEAEDSENKNKLVEVIERLSTVLFAVKRPFNFDFESTIELVEYCQRHCNCAEMLMDETKGTAPNLNNLFHNIKPHFDHTIKVLIEDAKEKAEIACKEAKGTRYENIACLIKKETSEWTGINDEIISMQIERFIKLVNKYMPLHEATLVYNELEDIKTEKNVTRLISTIVDDVFLLLSRVKTFEEFELLKKELVEIKEMLEPTISLRADIFEIKENTQIIIENIDELIDSINQFKISFNPSIKEEIQVTVGLSGFGSGVKHVVTIPLQDISYPELKDDLRKYSDKMLDIAKLPARLKDKVIGYIRKNGNKLREE